MTLSTLRASALLVAALTMGAASALAQAVPDITVTPNPFDLGTFSVPGGENPVLQVRNDGVGPLVLSNAFVTDITGDGSFEDAFGSDLSFPLTLAPSESVDLTLLVSPATGRQDGTLTVESNDPDEPTVVVPITYFGTTVTFDVSPALLDFGSVFVRLDSFDEPISPPTVCRPLLISAEGDENGFADQFEIDAPFGASFSFQDQFSINGASDLSTVEVDVAAGDTTVVDVCYTPNEEGAVSATLRFDAMSNFNFTNTFSFEVGLTGEVTTTNLPPVPQGIADGDVIEVVVDMSRTISFSFASPESGQTTTIEVSDRDDFFDYFETTAPGNPATGEIEFSAFNGTGGYPTGDYDLGIEACDDAPGGNEECTTLTITVRVSYPPTQACDFDVSFYINEFQARPGSNYVQLYSTESGLVDLTGCSFVAFDAFFEKVVVALPLTFELFPFGEPNLVAGADFSGEIPSGPGAIAIVQGAPAIGDDVSTVLGDIINAIVYRTDEDIFGICGEGTLIGGAIEAFPCNNEEGRAALAEALTLLGNSVAADDGADLDLSVIAAPNPVPRVSTVSFGLAQAGDVHVALFDALGRQVATLAEGPHGAGRHEVRLDASGLPAGVYVVRAVIGGETRTTRLTVVR